MNQFPRHKEEPEYEKPAYVTDVKYAMTGGIMIGGMVGKRFNSNEGFPEYKHKMYHKSHGTDRVIEVAMREWDQWQADWKARGIEHEYVPYPYTKEMVTGWFKEWSELTKVPITADGPDEN